MNDDVDGRLERAQARAAEKSALGARHDALLRQIVDREATLRRLDKRLEREESDVRALEGKSLSAMFATMLGNKDARLRAERADVLRATLARDAEAAAIRELRAAEKPVQEALWALGDATAELESARRAKEADLVARGDAPAHRLAEIDAAQSALDRFSRELADVRQGGGRGPMVVEIGAFSKFADFFFDGLIADWVVQERISESRANVASVRRDVAEVRHRLAAQIVAIRTESESLARERARVVEGA